mmetsp:Transcript_86281/g.186434  ORF Transcript_86281/g.186434 Transcript_86281/m.186434 type:complete len:282 (+) Transcript_86281:3135-3980(+)
MVSSPKGPHLASSAEAGEQKVTTADAQRALLLSSSLPSPLPLPLPLPLPFGFGRKATVRTAASPATWPGAAAALEKRSITSQRCAVAGMERTRSDRLSSPSSTWSASPPLFTTTRVLPTTGLSSTAPSISSRISVIARFAASMPRAASSAEGPQTETVHWCASMSKAQLFASRRRASIPAPCLPMILRKMAEDSRSVVPSTPALARSACALTSLSLGWPPPRSLARMSKETGVTFSMRWRPPTSTMLMYATMSGSGTLSIHRHERRDSVTRAPERTSTKSS